ncbi:MAG: nucleotidyl transferase AbiEii/AbiGii toxin family protein [Deltaproteobacteria bacterium]|nr:nucleotidyl transferase AbiEii/AbiGii toxin family protein [Deltaproteobacteria bacterium]
MPTLSETAIREVFHLFFLERLFMVSEASQYVLKGGVNLRFFFASPRYSEDMDLDVVAGSVETLKKNGFKILEDKSLGRAMQAFGVRAIQVNDPTKAKQTTTTQRFRVRLVTTAGIELPTKVEFSRRPRSEEYAVVTESIPGDRTRPYGRLGFPCPHYDGRSAALQKARALPGRETPQCRDVFDLHILALGGHVNRELLREHLTKKERADARAVIDSLEHDAYEGQVVEFLDDEARARHGTSEAWDEMRLRVMELFDDG